MEHVLEILTLSENPLGMINGLSGTQPWRRQHWKVCTPVSVQLHALRSSCVCCGMQSGALTCSGMM